jgi:hypothetical protein
MRGGGEMPLWAPLWAWWADLDQKATNDRSVNDSVFRTDHLLEPWCPPAAAAAAV